MLIWSRKVCAVFNRGEENWRVHFTIQLEQHKIIWVSFNDAWAFDHMVLLLAEVPNLDCSCIKVQIGLLQLAEKTGGVGRLLKAMPGKKFRVHLPVLLSIHDQSVPVDQKVKTQVQNWYRHRIQNWMKDGLRSIGITVCCSEYPHALCNEWAGANGCMYLCFCLLLCLQEHMLFGFLWRAGPPSCNPLLNIPLTGDTCREDGGKKNLS